MSFLVDAQLPPTLSRWLVAQGHAAAKFGDLAMQTSSDGAIWNHAPASSLRTSRRARISHSAEYWPIKGRW
jgi:predicted nuclease of predicted toxin-antitoxin system